MFVKKSISNGRTFLVIAQGYRKDGKVRHKTIEKLGYLDDLKKQYEDPIAHFKEITKNMSKENVNEYLIKNLKNKVINNSSQSKNLGYVALRQIYKELDLEIFLKDKNIKVQFDFHKIFSLLVYSRILYPGSKKETYEKRDQFFENFDGFELEDIYRSLDYFNQYKEEIETLLWNNTKDKYNRKKIIYTMIVPIDSLKNYNSILIEHDLCLQNYTDEIIFYRLNFFQIFF